MKKTLALFILAASLAGCSSGVKLDAPVEDRSGNTTSQSSGSADAQASKGGVTSVDLGSTGGTNGGPANVGKIVYFDFDSYLVKPEYAGVIEAHVKFLASRKTQKITVEGHTDAVGGREYNLALGQKRAEAVRRSLALTGLPDAQIEAVSFGKEKPAALGSDEASMAKNRRAEISYR
ncbi:MAG: peptidoglycan-associated lipoprotein Pal [Burkholderiaceae bacterium]|nr:peptidoglycan-associated lipoprotein Pal [Burkholderiaceae bacterium]